MTTIINEQVSIGVDRLGDTYSVWFTSSIKDVAGLFIAFLRQYADLIEAGHAPTGSNLPIGATTPAIYIKYGNTIAASLTYRVDGNLAWIIFTNVDDRYRRRGLYTQLHKTFETNAVRVGCNRAGSLLHVNNKRIRAISEVNGYTPEFVRMTKKLS